MNLSLFFFNRVGDLLTLISVCYPCYNTYATHVMKQVNYINAHATSTIAGDMAEVNAIKKVFKNTSEIKVNGTKVNFFN
jgi:ABC-type phosphate transport system ATPase subunit